MIVAINDLIYLSPLLYELNTKDEKEEEEEQLYIGTAESEHIEMYLKAIRYIRERGKEVKVSSIANLFKIKQPSLVQMFH